MKLIKILTIIILILFPFGELLRLDIGNNITLKPLDITVGITVLIWFIYHLPFCHSHERGNTIGKNTFFHYKKEFMLFPLIGLVSLIINSSWIKPYELGASFLYLTRWVAYASLFFVVLGFDKTFKKKIKIYLFIDGLVILIFGFIQYFFFSSLKPFYYLGWDEHMYRIFSVFLDPNYAGAFFVLYFLFIGDFIFKRKRQRDYLIFILLLTLIAIFLTFSRSALLMLFAGSFTYLFLIKRKKLIFAVLGAIIFFIVIFYSKFNNENMNLFRSASSNARLANYSLAVKIFSDRPLFGVGFNTYRYAKEMYGIQMGWINAPSHADAGVDNSFLFVLATTGITGFSAYLFLWTTIMKKAPPLVISSIIALFINALFINSLFFPPLMLWTWLILALL